MIVTNERIQGQAGSDVAKDASDIILTDDNFASILNAVEEGRRLFDNIKRFVLHVLAENIAQATTLLVGLVFKDANGNSVFPLAPVQILWVIMVRENLTYQRIWECQLTRVVLSRQLQVCLIWDLVWKWPFQIS